MPAYRCPFGHRIDMSMMPSPNEFFVLPKTAIETLVEELLQIHRTAKTDSEFEKNVYTKIYQHEPRFPQLLECPECGTLMYLRDARYIGVYKRTEESNQKETRLSSEFES